MASQSAFALAALAQLDQELVGNNSMERSALAPCGREILNKVLSAVRMQSQDYAKELSQLCFSSHEAMKEARHHPTRSLAWRRLYTDAALAWALLDILGEREAQSTEDEKFWKDAIERLDGAIVIAGAPGEGKLDLVLDAIEQIQHAFLPLSHSPLNTIVPVLKEETALFRGQVPSASLPVPVLPGPPSMSAFRTTHSRAPFILRRFADDWPAVRERRWASKSYLQEVAGRGRVVPVEIGRDYRTEDWTQRMMDWDEFLDYLFQTTEPTGNVCVSGDERRKVMYLAQHDLFKQFPALRRDVVIPDYVYASLPPPERHPQYRPPANNEELILNTWLGPRGTVSPAHTDPYYNFYTQVTGRKTVWLTPPSVSDLLSPYSELHSNGTSPSPSQQHTPSGFSLNKTESTNSMLSNTSRLDVFASASDLQLEPELVRLVPVAMSAVLNEGDMLFFPPGWWHAFRSESASFSVSMWF